MTEQYLVIEPSGEVRWEEIRREALLDRLHEIIDCDCVEQVRTIIPDLVLIVDESGRVKTPPKEHNELCSWLYMGWIVGVDDIVGTAVLATLKPVGPYHELDWFTITDRQKAFLLSLGFEIPDK